MSGSDYAKVLLRVPRSECGGLREYFESTHSEALVKCASKGCPYYVAFSTPYPLEEHLCDACCAEIQALRAEGDFP